MPMWVALHMLTLKYHNQRRVCWANCMALVVLKSPAYLPLWLLSVFFPPSLSPYPQMKIMHLFHAPWWHAVFDYQVWRGHPLWGDLINIYLSSAYDIELSLSLWCYHCYRNWILDPEVSELKYLHFFLSCPFSVIPMKNHLMSTEHFLIILSPFRNTVSWTSNWKNSSLPPRILGWN